VSVRECSKGSELPDFTELIDLASERLGGVAMAANDEFFAPKERLLLEGAPISVPDRYTARGKWMDGWETRRRREPGHDWCIVRLGLAGTIHGILVETTHFVGNYPEACSLDACAVTGYPKPDELEAAAWTEVLPRSVLQGDTRNRFVIDRIGRFTHVRLNIFPDGGVARLRVFGRVVPDWARLVRPGCEVDLASVEHGALVTASSDMFFGSRQNLIMPGRAHSMGDGWETRRRRGPGHDWVIVQLGAPGRVHRADVDTTHFKGNAPGSCSLEGCDAGGLSQADLMSPDRRWDVLMPVTRLLPHTRHVFTEELAKDRRVTHVRFNIFPDGGVGRLKLYGVPEF
jgi:allantoicase